MKIDFAMLDRLAAAGATAQVIIEVLRASDAKRERKRSGDRTRQKAKRERQTATSGDIAATSGDNPSQIAERELYAIGKKAMGKSAGGLVSSLIRHHNYDLAAARRVVDVAITKQDPREYLVSTMRSSNGKSAKSLAAAGDDLIARAEEFERTFNLGRGEHAEDGGEGGQVPDWPVSQPPRR